MTLAVVVLIAVLCATTVQGEEAQGRACFSSLGGPGRCTPLSECGLWAGSFLFLKGDGVCPLVGGPDGICCPLQPDNVTSAVLVHRPRRRTVIPMMARHLSSHDVNGACQRALEVHHDVVDFEGQLEKLNVKEQPGSPGAFHQGLFRVANDAHELGRKCFSVAIATNNLKERVGMAPRTAEARLSQVHVRDTMLGDACPPEPLCFGSRLYRTIDGSCNNEGRPSWGKRLTPLIRLLPSLYDDGVWTPRRTSVSGSLLPSARLISSSAIDISGNSPEYGSISLMFMQWGQFIDHDMTISPIFTSKSGTIKCCTGDGRGFISPTLRHPACFAIDVPANDKFYGPKGIRCMSFIRSMPGPRADCDFGSVEQMNSLTSFLDASAVYGSTDEEARKIRGPRGTLRVTPGFGRQPDILPQDHECQGSNQVCFMAGEARVNEQIHLTIIHTIFHREHNRIAEQLARINPTWDDETIYQESRKIVAALIQHITYNEFLPVLLGPRVMLSYGIQTSTTDGGYSMVYDPTVDPSISNEFAGAAFRLGHSLVSGTLRSVMPNYQVQRVQHLKGMFNNPLPLLNPEEVNNLIRGQVDQPVKAFDSTFEKDICEHLFESQGRDWGLDLIALNIQRGRDHGLPPYNQYRQLCGLKLAKSFQDLSDVMTTESIARLAATYADVNDIDLYIGGVNEQPIHGSILGPTFLCIVGDQFTRLKRGDRYFYDIKGHPHSFTPAQLGEIRKQSMARVLCDNSGIGRIQPLAFFVQSFRNPTFDCRDHQRIPAMSLEPWRQSF